MVVPEQASDPEGAAKVATPVHNPGEAFTEILAGQLMNGGVTSLTVTVNEQLVAFPLTSVATPTTVVVPKANTDPEAGDEVTEAMAQLSDAFGAE